MVGALVLVLCLVAARSWGDGGFVAPAFVWNRAKDIDEPSQKAILLHDAGREDLILQVRYEGSLEEFGWLIPVPTQPTVARASMESFYELSRYVQEHLRPLAQVPTRHLLGGRVAGPDESVPVRVIEYKTVGVYETAVLSTADPRNLQQWLKQNGFVCPPGSESTLEFYTSKQYFFVAVRVHLDGTSAATPWLRSKDGTPIDAASVAATLSRGELHPLKISFDTPKCIYPLKISALNGRPSEVHLYVFASEPMTHRALTHARFLEYANSHSTEIPEDLLLQTPAGAVAGASLPLLCRDLPRLQGRTWSLVKHERTFAPADMQDLECHSLVPLIAAHLKGPYSELARRELSAFGLGALGR